MHKLKPEFLHLSFGSLASLAILKSRKFLSFSHVLMFRMTLGNAGKHLNRAQF